MDFDFSKEIDARARAEALLPPVLMTAPRTDWEGYAGIGLAILAALSLIWRFRRTLQPRMPQDPTPRALLAAGIIALAPWVAARLIFDASDYGSLKSYAAGAVLPLLGGQGRWGSHEWYDRLAGAGLATLTVALWWRPVVLPLCRKLAAWIMKRDP